MQIINDLSLYIFFEIIDAPLLPDDLDLTFCPYQSYKYLGFFCSFTLNYSTRKLSLHRTVNQSPRTVNIYYYVYTPYLVMSSKITLYPQPHPAPDWFSLLPTLCIDSRCIRFFMQTFNIYLRRLREEYQSIYVLLSKYNGICIFHSSYIVASIVYINKVTDW